MFRFWFKKTKNKKKQKKTKQKMIKLGYQVFFIIFLNFVDNFIVFHWGTCTY